MNRLQNLRLMSRFIARSPLRHSRLLLRHQANRWVDRFVYGKFRLRKAVEPFRERTQKLFQSAVMSPWNEVRFQSTLYRSSHITQGTSVARGKTLSGAIHLAGDTAQLLHDVAQHNTQGLNGKVVALLRAKAETGDGNVSHEALMRLFHLTLCTFMRLQANGVVSPIAQYVHWVVTTLAVLEQVTHRYGSEAWPRENLYHLYHEGLELCHAEQLRYRFRACEQDLALLAYGVQCLGALNSLAASCPDAFSRGHRAYFQSGIMSHIWMPRAA